MNASAPARHVVAFLAGTIAALLATGTIAAASIPGSDGRIHGCYQRQTGLLRVVDEEAGASCRGDEKAISWQGGTPEATPAMQVRSVTLHDVGSSFTTTGDTNVEVPGAALEFTVPEGATATVLVRFSVEAACTGASIEDDICAVSVDLDGSAMAPGGGTPEEGVVWQHAGGRFGSRSFEWARTGLAPGTHDVQVLARGGSLSHTAPYATFSLAKQTLSAVVAPA